MNAEMVKRALEAFRNGGGMKEFEAELRAKRAAREAFAKSETFMRMLESFKGQTERISIDSEEASYSPDKVRAQAGWDFATIEDINHFFDVVADSHAETVEPGSVAEDEDCPFDNVEFRNLGMSVRRMSGQGTFICIRNR
jgi:hypothetical protein